MTTSTKADRTVARRDSATSILRKLGVSPRDYPLFITESNGSFTVAVAAAEAHAAKVSEQVATGPAKKRPAKRPDGAKKAPAPSGPRAEGTAERIRGLIRAGKSNEEIIAALELPASKRSYPTWYRAEMKRKQLA